MNINVTKSFLPKMEDYQRYISGIWDRVWLTNNGPLVNELEIRLKEYLGIDHLLFLSNGTIALQVAIKALSLKGEIITTPFSYVATTSSIVWEGCEPVMVDIRPDTLNIDPDLIESAITDKTSAILATHVFGNPCDVEKISEIAKRHNLNVIYDAAHAFGVRYKGRSLYGYGDISTASFHATKIFHTIEGGAVVTQDPERLRVMAMLRNFGHSSATEFGGLGINAKNSEFHAAMGLAVLPYFEEIVEKRRKISERYVQNLSDTRLSWQDISDNCEYNYSYFPTIFESEDILIKTLNECNKSGIFPRRYFYPSLNNLPYIKSKFSVPNSEDIARRIICLPLYESLSIEEVDMICRVIKRSLRY